MPVYKVANVLADNNDAWLGVKINPVNGRNIISIVVRNSPAWIEGLSANDEILAIDNNSITDVDKYIATKKPGDQITININRDGLPITLKVKLAKSPLVKYMIAEEGLPTPEQLVVRKKWLKL